jgi:hypothetical protein
MPVRFSEIIEVQVLELRSQGKCVTQTGIKSYGFAGKENAGLHIITA